MAMSDPVELTRDLLMDAGGWKEMKSARRLHRDGKVEEARYEDGELTGVVREGVDAKKVRMKIISRSHMENSCTCPRARREGIVCAHAVAVGLEVIEPTRRTASEEQVAAAVPAGPDPWPVVVEEATEEAVAVECHVILPLRVGPSWERGNLMVGVEVESEGEQYYLSAFGPDWTLFAGPRDASLLAVLKELSPGEVPGVMGVGREAFLKLLDVLAGHPRVMFGKKEEAQVGVRPVRPPVTVRGMRVQVRWPEGLVPLVGKAGAWALDGTVFHPVAPGLPERMRGMLEGGHVIEPAAARVAMAALRAAFEVPEELWRELPQPAEPAVVVHFEGSLNHLEARVAFRYGTTLVPAGSAEPEVIEVAGGSLLRSPDAERLAEDELAEWGFAGTRKQGTCVLKDKQGILHFHAFGFPKLSRHWEVTTGERFNHASGNVVAIEPAFEFRGSGEDWFSMSMEFRAGTAETVSRDEIRRLFETGVHHKTLKGGRLAVANPGMQDALAETLLDCDPEQDAPGVFRMDRRQAAYLREVARTDGIACGGKVPWTDDAPRPVADLGDLKDVLRPYQLEGVQWLSGLSELGMGGILADDMGLGKTLQVLVFMKSAGGPSLVVCPSSLVFNWMSEAAKFVPGLKAVAVTGSKRMEVLAENPDADLFVTSYALLRRDADVWREREFRVVVLDEAQQIKNPDAQVSKAAFRLRGTHRFALTGTPMENSVRDLWSIMHFAMPGYLGGRKEFEERFEKPITGGDAPGVQRRLAARLKPVVLRRLKQEVAKDLPEKIEQVYYCDLTSAQRGVYESILRESQTSILDAEGGRKRMLALTALLRLRQACCDLRLLNLPSVDPETASVKVEALERLVEEAVAGGHRVLVFSQFVQMLQVLVPSLGERGIRFCYLDGQTKNRGEVVERFQQDASIPVFLISLKAGGVGLNLTGADTVIHIDPWWNPAVEAQATDRAHRIGQERVVTSYKLITRGTVEEKIVALQEKKRRMIGQMLDADPAAESAGLTEAEIFALFE